MALNDNADAAKQERQERRKRKRWGVKVETTTTADAPSVVASASATASDPQPNAVAEKIRAMQESVRARLAAAKAAAAAAPGSNKRPADNDTAASSAVEAKRAKVYELDLSITAPTYPKQQEQLLLAATTHPSASNSSLTAVAGVATTAETSRTRKAPPSNPYLAHTAKNNDNGDDNISKPQRRHRRELHFVEPGKYQEIAAQKRERERHAAAAGFLSGRKQGHTLQSAQLLVPATTKKSLDSGSYGSSTTRNAVQELQHELPPRMDANPDATMPLIMEWWDVDLLPSKLKKQLATVESQALTSKTKRELQNQLKGESKKGDTAADATEPLNTGESIPVSSEDQELERLRTRCWEKASLSYSKTAALVQHIVPITSPLLSSSSSGHTAAPPQAVLHLTAKERRRQRKLRRQEQLRERQDLQAAGLLPAPEPRLTLQNFMQVLGHQAVLDPSQTEQKVQEQRLARQRAHEARNAAHKLTPAQRAQKRALKRHEDTTQTGVHVALYHVRNMSHPYHRTKVEVNAQQYNLTGLVLECQASSSSSSLDNFACVLVEGGPKGIQKFDRLMTVRMKWTGPNDPDDDDEEEDEEVNDGDTATVFKFDPHNSCERVWRGMAVQRLFRGFLFQAVTSPAQARQVLASKNVAHYWDHILLQHAKVTGQDVQDQRLGDDDDVATGRSPIQLPLKQDGQDDAPIVDNAADTEEDVVMKDA